MNRYILICYLVLACSTSILGQQAPITQSIIDPRVDFLLGTMPDKIKTLDEPAMRVFLRFQIANFLWAIKSKTASDAAEKNAADALVDLQEHKSEIPTLYVNLFGRDILATLRIHAPSIAAQMVKRYNLESGSDDKLDTAYSMLEEQDGVAPAVEKVSRVIKSGQDPGLTILFILHRLKEDHPAEVQRLLSEMLSTEEQKPGSLSIDSLSMLASFYVANETTPELKGHFLAVVVNATKNVSTLSDKDRFNGYNLLKSNLPEIEKLRPSLYAQAGAQMVALNPRLPKQLTEREAVYDRIKQSADPLNQTLTEAEDTKDSYLKDSLFTEAARTAMDKGKLRMAVDLIYKVEPVGKDRMAYRDQFLGEVINHAVAEKDVTVADYAASKIDADLKRASAIQNIAFYVFKSKDVFGARDRLAGALKLINAADNGVEKASALFRSIPVYAKVDEQRVPDLIPAAIKVVNDLPGPKSEDKPDSESHKAYVNTLLQVAYNVIPAFRALAGTNENEAFYLAGTFQRQEIKTAAIFGAATGIHTPTSTIINTHPTPKPAPIKQQPQN